MFCRYTKEHVLKVEMETDLRSCLTNNAYRLYKKMEVATLKMPNS